jgi:hypothetical protein
MADLLPLEELLSCEEQFLPVHAHSAALHIATMLMAVAVNHPFSKKLGVPRVSQFIATSSGCSDLHETSE